MESDPGTVATLATRTEVRDLLRSLLAETYNGNGTQTVSRKSLMLLPCENCLGQDEYIISLQEALREVLQENDVLRSRVIELEALLTQLEEDLQTHDGAINILQSQCPTHKKGRKGRKLVPRIM